MTDASKTTAPSKITALWWISLFCDCPSCEVSVDLLEDADFWDGRNLDIGEHGTERSRGVEVVCPDCDHEFKVDLEY